MSKAEAQASRDEPAHDVLAAEAFAVPAPDPVLHEAHEPAHDVLAAEEFALPAPDPGLHCAGTPLARGARSSSHRLAVAGAGALAAVALRLLRRR